MKWFIETMAIGMAITVALAILFGLGCLVCWALSYPQVCDILFRCVVVASGYFILGLIGRGCRYAWKHRKNFTIHNDYTGPHGPAI